MENKETKDNKYVTKLTPKTTEKAVASYEKSSWGMPQMTSSDLIIPYISVMQGSSEKVKDRTLSVSYGDIIDSRTNEILGSLDKTFNLVPFKVEKIIKTYNVDKQGQRKDVAAQVEWTALNDKIDYEIKDEKGNVVQKNFKVYKFFCLLENQVGTADEYPYILSLTSSSLNTGKNIFFQMNLDMQKKNYPCGTVFAIGAKEQTQKDGGSKFVVVTSNAIRPTNEKEVQACYNWTQKMNGSNVVDASEEAPF